MKTKNLAVGILVGVLVVALWWTMLLKPTRAKVAKAKTDAQTQEAKLAPLQAQLAQARRDAAHAAEFKAQLQSLQHALPNTPALAAFIRDANGIASASGVAWQSVTHAAPTPGADGVMSITVGMQVQGTYGQILDYLGRLASMKRLMVVDNLQLSPSTSGAARGRRPGDERIDGAVQRRRPAVGDDLGPHVRDAGRGHRRGGARPARRHRPPPRRPPRPRPRRAARPQQQLGAGTPGVGGYTHGIAAAGAVTSPVSRTSDRSTPCCAS